MSTKRGTRLSNNFGLPLIQRTCWPSLYAVGFPARDRSWGDSEEVKQEDSRIGQGTEHEAVTCRASWVCTCPMRWPPFELLPLKAAKPNSEIQSRGNDLVSCALLHKTFFSFLSPFPSSNALEDPKAVRVGLPDKIQDAQLDLKFQSTAATKNISVNMCHGIFGIYL